MTTTTTHHLSNATLEPKAENRNGVYFPGIIREAKTLLRTPENIDHRMILTSDAHRATNMAGGRYNDHLEALVNRYLGMRDDAEKTNFIEVLRATLKDTAREGSYRF